MKGKRGPFSEERIKPPKKVPFMTRRWWKYIHKHKYLDSLDKKFGHKEPRYRNKLF